jgi:hypothetical protein
MGRVSTRHLVQICLAAALLAALPAAALATPAPSKGSAVVKVSATGVSKATVRCPNNGVPLSGYVSSLSGGAFARDSVPGGIHGWNFNFTSTGGSGHAHVGLRCLRMKLPKGVNNVHTKIFTRKLTLHPAPGSSAKGSASCKSGYLPTGYGFDRSATTEPASRLQLTSAVPGKHGWSFRVRNTGTSSQPATLHVRCLGSRATAGNGMSERFKLHQESDSGTVGTGALGLRCPAGNFSLSAGYSVPAGDDISVTTAVPRGARSGRVSFRNPSGPKQRVHTYLTCLSLTTRFR